MKNKKTISIIATGGTIASGDTEKGLRPTYKLNEMLDNVPHIHDMANIRSLQLMNKDSSDMAPSDWIKIAVQVYKELQCSDGVVITHGTDTMAYTSSILSFMLQNVKKPIIITGSQRPWDEPETDAKNNIVDAVRVAVSGSDNELKGVYIVFHGKIIRGCRAKKSKYLERNELDAFDTINYPLVGIVKDRHIMLNPILMMSNRHDDKNSKMILDTKINNKVFMLMLTPGFDPEMLDAIKSKSKAIIIQAYGLGGMPIHGKEALVPKIKEWLDDKKVVAVTSQACYETDLGQYEVGRKFMELGVIPTLDMTQESAYTKLMWTMGHKDDLESARKMMWKNYSGEIWPLNGNSGKTMDIMGEMARYYELTRKLHESNSQLMEVVGSLFLKIKNTQTQ